ncbi:MAG TPA: GNAT family N-acetyltransferase [Anaerolineae bacterium]|nr:GNAT family N-acetyltransferase [Anaerolineae bacterium]HQH38651.1 GNAT family N-acetyltransferase [Anaerolineae bacterium]
MNIFIKPVQTTQDRRTFLTFPWRIYRDDPLWVPPLLPERARAVVKRQGPFFERGSVEFFIAWREGQPVGTICLAEDTPTNAARGTRECVFGFFECVEDYTVAEALLDYAAGWARQHHLDALFGPFNLDYEDGYGILVEGRDRPPVLLCGHTPPYYRTFVERYGFVPARATNVAYAFDLAVEHPTLQRLARLADKVRRRGDIVVRGADLSQWDAEVDRVHELLTTSLTHLDDYIPWSRASVTALVEPFSQIADPDLVLFAEVNGDNAGWFAGVPNVNEALIHANGLRYPWNYAQLWLALRHRPQCLAVKSLLVKPSYWKTGVAVLLFDEMVKRARAKGYTWIDLSLTSADNPDTPVLAERMGAKLYKQYQVYRVEVAGKA